MLLADTSVASVASIFPETSNHELVLLTRLFLQKRTACWRIIDAVLVNPHAFLGITLLSTSQAARVVFKSVYDAFDGNSGFVAFFALLQLPLGVGFLSVSLVGWPFVVMAVGSSP